MINYMREMQDKFFPRTAGSQKAMCRKHLFGQGDPVIPCPECGCTVQVVPAVQTVEQQNDFAGEVLKGI